MAAETEAHGQQAPSLMTGSQAVRLARDVLDAPLDVDISGVDLGVAARPAGPVFGGDTHGAFGSPDGEWTVLLADVAAHGHAAAAQTAVLRNSVHGLATAVKGPGMMLALLNNLLMADPTADRLCSAVMVRLHTASQDETGLRATIARAGHPYPLVLRADGRVEVLRPQGTLLGVDLTVSFDTDTVLLDPGDALMLYTDGLVNDWDRDPTAATTNLVELLQDSPAASAEDMARHLLDGLAPPGAQRDDATVVVLKPADVCAPVTSGAPEPSIQEGSATAAIEHAEATAAAVITVRGTSDAEVMTRLVDMLAGQYTDCEVVVDLSSVVMTNPAAIRALVAHLSAWADTTTLRIVCTRLTARRLLRRWGGGSLPVCASLAGALGSLHHTAAQPAAAVTQEHPRPAAAPFRVGDHDR